MPFGSCDPGVGNFNVTQLAKDNGRVTITVYSTWDGVSTWPDCDGPISSVVLRNVSPHAWTVTFPRGRTTKTRMIASSTNRTFTGAQLAGTIGLTTASDVFDFFTTNLTVNS